MVEKYKYNILLMLTLVVVAVLGRWMPHPMNFTPVVAVAMYAGVRLTPRWLVYLAPLLAMFISDLLLGFHSLVTFTYPALVVFAGLCSLGQNKFGATKLVGLSVGGSLLFFTVSNFGVWFMTGMYPMTFEGLTACYIAAIPFFHNTLISTLVFGSSLWAVEKLTENLWSHSRVQG